jgi:hypothetical protein
MVKYTPTLIEIMPNLMLYHGTTEINEICPVVKVGVYKMWTVWIFKMDPEISMVYEFSEGVTRCRDIKLNPLAVNGGIRIQW